MACYAATRAASSSSAALPSVNALTRAFDRRVRLEARVSKVHGFLGMRRGREAAMRHATRCDLPAGAGSAPLVEPTTLNPSRLPIPTHVARSLGHRSPCFVGPRGRVQPRGRKAQHAVRDSAWRFAGHAASGRRGAARISEWAAARRFQSVPPVWRDRDGQAPSADGPPILGVEHEHTGRPCLRLRDGRSVVRPAAAGPVAPARPAAVAAAFRSCGIGNSLGK